MKIGTMHDLVALPEQTSAAASFLAQLCSKQECQPNTRVWLRVQNCPDLPDASVVALRPARNNGAKYTCGRCFEAGCIIKVQ